MTKISGVKHIVLSITPEGEFVTCSSTEVVEAYKESLVGKFSSVVAPAVRPFFSIQVSFYKKLPLPASSPQFICSKLLRSTFADLLTDA